MFANSLSGQFGLINVHYVVSSRPNGVSEQGGGRSAIRTSYFVKLQIILTYN